MKQKKSIFLVKIYIRKKNKCNDSLNSDFGAFSSVDKAKMWVKKNGKTTVKEFCKGYPHKKLFFAVLEYSIDTDGWDVPVAKTALDLDGNETYFFKY